MSLDLRALQAFVTGALQAHEPIGVVPSLREGAERLVASHPVLGPADQLEIYRKQFWSRHVDALLEDHEGLAYVLDAPEGGASGLEHPPGGAWDRLARAYLAAHPPTHPSLRDLEHALAAFTAAFALEPLVGPERAALARDMARYESILVELFDAPDHPALGRGAFTGLAPEEAAARPLALHPTVRLVSLAHDAPELRLAVREGRAPSLAPGAWRRPGSWAVFRPDTILRFEPLEPAAFALARALCGGAHAPPPGFAATLAEACERLVEELPEEALGDLGASLPRWLGRFLEIGLFAAR